jgi:hypothetical protein
VERAILRGFRALFTALPALASEPQIDDFRAHVLSGLLSEGIKALEQA